MSPSEFETLFKKSKRKFDRVSGADLKYDISFLQWLLYERGFLLAKFQPTQKQQTFLQ